MSVCNLHCRAKHQIIVHFHLPLTLFAHKIKNVASCHIHYEPVSETRVYIMNFSSEGVKYWFYKFGGCNGNSLTDLMVSSKTPVVALKHYLCKHCSTCSANSSISVASSPRSPWFHIQPQAEWNMPQHKASVEWATTHFCSMGD